MAKWERGTLRLKKNHQWRAKPGYQICVLDRGALRFDFPASWTMTPTTDAIKFNDKPPPDDDCLLQASVWYLAPGIDWSELPLPDMVHDIVVKDERQLTPRGEVVRVRRPDLVLAWQEASFTDPVEQREAHSRACLAHAGRIMGLVTMDYWPEDAARFEPVWDEVLRSLRLGQYVKDPRTGARFGYG